jgi:hypothetical protein
MQGMHNAKKSRQEINPAIDLDEDSVSSWPAVGVGRIPHINIPAQQHHRSCAKLTLVGLTMESNATHAAAVKAVSQPT